MIRAILVVGWIGMLLLAFAAVTGYQAKSEETAQHHMVTAMFPTGALLFADLCLLVYMPGTARVVRRTVSEAGLGGDWVQAHRRLARRGALLGAVAALVTGALFGSGFPAFSGLWPAWIHHALFFATLLAQAAFLLAGGAALRAGETRLAELGRMVEERRPAA